jgi:hypothetical protein
MRGLFGVVGLLIVVAIVGMLAKKQLAPASIQPVSVDGREVLSAPAPGSTPQQQSQQIQRQVQQSVEKAMQQERPMPEGY